MDVPAFIALIKDESKFTKLNETNRLVKFRKAVFELLIARKSQAEYLDISEYTAEEVKTLRAELEQAEWKSDLSYGDTGLFIYRGEKPAECWT